MNSNHYKYDVAFSFTQKDEVLAKQLYSLLQGRLNCFLYSEAQKDLAGRDGEMVFQTVFEKEARIVVIIHREEYGKTKWTRVEETAIKNRGFEEGYDFVILIPTSKPPTPPKWLPKNRLWIGLERWGIESAASVIEARVQEFGGTVKEQSAADIAAKTEENILKGKERKTKINLGNAKKELSCLQVNLERQINELSEKIQDWKIQVKPNNKEGWNISYYGVSLIINWYQQYSNILDDSSLSIRLINGYVDENDNIVDPFSEMTLIENDRYYFYINEFEETGWKNNSTFYTSKKLIDFWVENFVKSIVQKRKKDNQ